MNNKSKSKSTSKSTSTIKNASKITRISPSESATLFKLGTIKTGNNGKLWIIKETSNGNKRWVPYQDVFQYIQFDERKEIIKGFNFSYVLNTFKKFKLKKIGSIDIKQGILGVGELLYDIYRVKNGYYDIYYYAGSLIAIHADDDLTKQTYKLINKPVLVDAGMFAFHNHSLVIPERKSRKYITYPNDAYLKCLDRSKNNASFLYVRNFDMRPSSDDDDDTIISVFADNQYGDGEFSLYQGDNSFFIMSHNVETALINKVMQ